MEDCRNTKVGSILRVIGSVASVGLLISSTGALADNSSWSKKPSWAISPTPYSSYSPYGQKDEESSRRSVTPMSPDSHNVAVNIGQVFLMGNMGDHFNDNIGGKLSYVYGVSDIFGFNGSVGYSSHSKNANESSGMSLTTVQAGVRVNLSWYDRIVPHAVAGLGFYRPSFQLSDQQSESAVLFGFHMGPGVDLALTKQFYFGTAITFHDIFGGKRFVANQSSAETEKLDFGGTYTTFYVHAGMAF